MAIFSKMAAKGIFAIVPDMLKDHKGKWSSKRTVSGVLAVAAVSNIDTQGITWENALPGFNSRTSALLYG